MCIIPVFFALKIKFSEAKNYKLSFSDESYGLESIDINPLGILSQFPRPQRKQRFIFQVQYLHITYANNLKETLK